jgi:hypothetical protein
VGLWRRWLNLTVAITGVYETVLYAADVSAAARFYADALGCGWSTGRTSWPPGFGSTTGA